MKSNMQSRQVVLMHMANPMAHYVVRRMNANGSFSKKHPTQFDFCRTREAAEARKEMLKKMNPHKEYGIDHLATSSN